MLIKFVEVPSYDASWEELGKFAASYNGYERFCANTLEFQAIFANVERLYYSSGLVSDDLGVDFLRAWLFLLYRYDHFDGSSGIPEVESLWRLLVSMIRDKSNGTVLVLQGG